MEAPGTRTAHNVGAGRRRESGRGGRTTSHSCGDALRLRERTMETWRAYYTEVRFSGHPTRARRTSIERPPGYAEPAASVVDEVELLPLADRRPVRDQRVGPGVVGGHDLVIRVRAQADAAVGVLDQIELRPVADRRAVGGQRGGARVVRRDDVIVRVRAEADRDGIADQVEFLPGADRGAVGDQRGGAGVVRRDDVIVCVGAEADAAVRVADQVKGLPLPDGGAVGDKG